MATIVITVEGGVVQDVSSDDPEAVDVILIDEDVHSVSEYGVTKMTTGAIQRYIEDAKNQYGE